MLYVIGAVSNVPGLNRDHFEEARKKAWAAHPGADIVIPHDFIPADAGWGEAMRKSVMQLMRCERAVVVVDEFLPTSKGLSVELDLCNAIGIPYELAPVGGLYDASVSAEGGRHELRA